MLIYKRIFWFILVPAWLLAAALPFLDTMFGTGLVYSSPSDDVHVLYGYFVFTYGEFENYFIGIIASAFLMQILWRIEFICANKLAAEKELEDEIRKAGM